MKGCWLYWVAVSCFITLTACNAEPQRSVVVTAPKVFLAGTIERVCFVFANIHGDGIVEVNLYEDTKEEKLQSTAAKRIHDGASACLDVHVSNSNSSTVIFEVSCYFSEEEYTFVRRTTMPINHQSAMTLIQTDKPIYKPGQTVKFRILRLNTNLTPVVHMMPEIWIEDSSGIRMAQWLNVETDDGLVDLQLALSQEPVLGQWSIKVKVGPVTEVQHFEVKQYVLPKFDVKITSPPFILLAQPSATWKICAYYSYGKPVQGTAEVEGTQPDCMFFRKDVQKTQIFGCVNVTGFIRTESRSCRRSVELRIKVTEDGTGETVTRSTKETIHHQRLILEFASGSLNYFRPGLPYSGKLRVMHPDMTPAANEQIKLSVGGRKGWIREKILGSRSAFSDANGLIAFTIGPLPNEFDYVYVQADAKKLHSDFTIITDNPTGIYRLQPWYSPSQSQIQVDKLHGVAQCNKEEYFTVRVVDDFSSLTNFIVFSYQVISRGNIIIQNSVSPHLKPIQHLDEYFAPSSFLLTPNDTTVTHYHKFRLALPILPAMFPVSRLLVFYTRPDGEVVSASVKFEVQNCFTNKVTLTFNPAEVMPAETSKMHLTASTHSLCGIGVVDKSVHFLGKNNQLTPDKVLKELSKFDIDENSYHLKRSPPVCSSHSENGYPTALMFEDLKEVLERRRLERSMIRFVPENYYADSLHAFEDAGVVVMSDLNLETRPCVPARENSWQLARIISPEPYRQENDFPVIDSLSNHRIMPLSITTPVKNKAKVASKSKVEVRNYFPETWLWELHRIGENGFVETERTLPHTITDWVGTAFCTSRLDGIGISQPVTVRAFQPFFLTYTLPYSVKRGETLPIIVSISNYLQECLPMKITLEESKFFSVLSDSTIAKICVCGDEVKTHRFIIRPKVLGSVNVTVHGYTTTQDVCPDENGVQVSKTNARDAISKQLLIKAEGFPKEETWSSLICPETPENALQQEIDVFLPEAAVVPDSARAYFSVFGDLMGPSLHGLDHLVKLPVGCGEQNMVLFAPNIFVMHYLNTTDQLTPDLKTKLISHMQTGYQRELTYKHDDGSYSAFGNSDREGSMWLTAFVIKTFAQAKPFIFIDEGQTHQSMQWILSRQLENGCFPFWGRVLHKGMKGGLSHSSGSYTPLTAYVLISLLEAGMPHSSKSIENAFYCLKAENNPDVYTLVLSLYAAVLAKKDDLATDLLTKLDGHETVKDNMLYWEIPSKNSPALNVELSAYAILCLTELGKMHHLEKASKAIRWITKQRNANGGFVSTQDTVVALQALAKFASIHTEKDIQLDIAVEADELQHNFEVNKENKLLLQSIRIPQVPTVISLSVSGEGCALVQTTLRYNLEKKEGSNAFQLTVDTQPVGTTSASCKRHKVSICTRYKMEDQESNMVVVEVIMISGFEPDKESMIQVAKDDSVKLKRWDIDGDTLNMYFDELTNRQKCFSFIINQAVEVSNVKPSVVTVYDYYQPELSVEVNYTLKEVCAGESLSDLSEDEMLDLESQIVPGIEAFDIPQKTTPKPPAPESSPEDGGDRVPVDEIIPPPVSADLLGDEFIVKPEALMFKNFKDISEDLDFPSGVEGPEANYVRPSEDFMREFSQNKDLNCPHCLHSPPLNFKELYCNSTFAFTAMIRNELTSKMKVIHDMNKNLLRPSRKSATINYIIPEHCTCSFGKPGGRILVIGATGFSIDDVVDLKFTNDTYILSVPDKPLEPEYVKKSRQECAA